MSSLAQKPSTQQPKPRYNARAWDSPTFDDLRKAFSEENLRHVLTHESYYSPKKNEAPQGNGRYIFAGMFVFKGQVGDILYKYISGSGTHLQHILGNLFRNEILERLYDTWHLGQYVRAG